MSCNSRFMKSLEGRLFLPVLAAVFCLTASVSAEAATFRTVVVSGQPFPGVGGGTVAPRNDFAINDEGDVAFSGVLSKSDGSVAFGVFSDDGPVALTGQQAPGLPDGVTFRSAGGPVAINGSGEIVFQATLQGPGVDSTNAEALFSSRRGLLYRQGDPAPGLPDGTKFVRLANAPDIDDQGRIAFRAVIQGPTTPTLRAVYVDDAPQFVEGDQFPDLPGGVLIDTVGIPTISESGIVTFVGLPEGGGFNSFVDRFIISDGRIVTGAGDSFPRPGGGTDQITGLGLPPESNDSGQIAAQVAINGDFLNSALFLDGAIALRPGDALFDPLTGAATGLIYDGTATGKWNINNGGVAVLGVGVEGPGIAFSERGLVRLAPGGVPELLLRGGDTLEVLGEARTLSSVLLSASNPGAINDFGDVLFSAIYQDGQGVFQSALLVMEAERTSPTPVPAPAGVWLLVSGSGVLGAVGWRRRDVSAG
jgi:hypothetical protein